MGVIPLWGQYLCGGPCFPLVLVGGFLSLWGLYYSGAKNLWEARFPIGLNEWILISVGGYTWNQVYKGMNFP